MGSCGYELVIAGGTVLVDPADVPQLRRFTWKVSRHGAHKYARTNVKVGHRWRTVLMHRFLVGLEAGDARCVDHRDGNGLNNCRVNLRICERGQNSKNRGPTRGRLGFKGVHLQGGLYVSRIGERDRAGYIGIYPSAVEAAVAYNDEAAARFGEFARANVIHEEPRARELIREKQQLAQRIEQIDAVLRAWACV